jgi:nicotinamidase-related amidase
MRALLIIDMQCGSFTPAMPRYDTNGVINRINRLSDYFRENHHPVIFIQHDGSAHHNYCPGTPEWELLPELIRDPSDIVISKTLNDSFHKSSLEAFLKEKNINELVITGCATDFCVDSTVRSGLTLGYVLTVIRDGHTTANRPGLKAEEVINHHNWLWENLIPVKNGIKVQSTAEFLSL